MCKEQDDPNKMIPKVPLLKQEGKRDMEKEVKTIKSDFDLEELLKQGSYWKYYYGILQYDLHWQEVEENTYFPGSEVTAATEICGDKYIEEKDLWEVLFPGYKKSEKIKDRKRQKKGIDYIITDKDGKEINIDIKVCIGDSYLMNTNDFVGTPTRDDLKKTGVALEIEQQDYKTKDWIFTFNSFKKTDYLLFIIMDKDGQRYSLMSYKDAQNYTFQYRGYLAIGDDGFAHRYHRDNNAVYKVHQSLNKSGFYIKVPVECKEK